MDLSNAQEPPIVINIPRELATAAGVNPRSKQPVLGPRALQHMEQRVWTAMNLEQRRELARAISRALRAAAGAVSLVMLLGCGTADLARILFTSETAKEQVIEGVRGRIEPLTLASSPDTGALPGPVLDALLGSGGQGRIAVLMEVLEVGGPSWWILCAGSDLRICETIPSAGHVRVAGTPLPGSAIIIPSRVGSSD